MLVSRPRGSEGVYRVRTLQGGRGYRMRRRSGNWRGANQLWRGERRERGEANKPREKSRHEHKNVRNQLEGDPGH